MRNFKLLFASILALFTFHIQAVSQQLVSSQLLSTTPSFLLGAFTNLPLQFDVRYYRITYNTIDPFGEPTVASGAVAVPVPNTTCNSYALLGYCHGTVLRQNDVPSQENFEGIFIKVAASAGYVAFAPDYLGLGVNLGIHPYVHAETQATATLDMIPAINEFLADLEFDVSADQGIYITGYSQGGHAAMATIKYAQDNDLYTDQIVAGAPCSGPYALSVSQTEVLLSDVPYSNPGYIVYLLIGYQHVYGNLYTNLSDIIQEPYASLVESYFTTDQTTTNMDVVNALLPNSISDLLVDSVLENFTNNLNHPLRIALADNDNFDWAPNIPVRMYYCDGDEQVDFTNSTTTLAAMQANGAADVTATNILPGADHGGCVIPALQAAISYFSQSAGCTVLSVNDVQRRQLKIFPNPAQSEVQFTALEKVSTAYIQDVAGRIVLEKKALAGQNTLDISSIAVGNYIMSIWDGEVLYQSKIAIIR